ncbi:uncharacterized protein LOC116391370 [Anarrhichthys ocellatus]|uniref:uncharacterized protein LOC116391370 n=1 Tax=Anarrhichthys ocellatus TaxID=433405 RepID=UPI0012EDE4CE|nr:uncharacterized protein LOC116391370 [Anarrhichthys ocellatus]
MKELCHQQKVEAETASNVETCCHRVDALEESVRSLRDTVQKYPDPEELSHQCETWDLMQSSLLSQRGDVPTVLVDAEVRATHTPFNSNLTAGSAAPPPSSTLNPVEEASRPAAPGAPGAPTTSGPTSGPTSMDAGSPLSEPPQQMGFKADPAAGSSLSERYSETLEALRNIEQLGARVAALEEGKADQSQLRHLREHMTDESSQDAMNHLMDQLNQQRALIDSLMSDRGKLDDLRSTLEDTMESLTSQPSEAGQDESAGSQSKEQSRENTGQKLSLLFHHYEQLQDAVSGLLQQQTGGPAGPPKLEASWTCSTERLTSGDSADLLSALETNTTRV